MSQFIFTMKGLGKIYPPDSVVFQDIWLSFLYGAKIGVIGANGSGKSTLLRIMAGLEPNYTGEATLSAGYTVGYLAQDSSVFRTLSVEQNLLGMMELLGMGRKERHERGHRGLAAPRPADEHQAPIGE